MLRHGMAWYGIVWGGIHILYGKVGLHVRMTWHGMGWYGGVWYVCYGMAWYDVVRYDMEW
jgi:hypothetical protein